MVEFALILIPLLILVVGIIQFGIGLNYWLDMNRFANQGARWAAVNNWPPQCLRTDNPDPPYSGSGCQAPRRPVRTGARSTSPFHTQARLQEVLRCQTRNPSTTPSICYPGVTTLGDQDRGDPVKVKLTAPYKFWFLNSLASPSRRPQLRGSNRSQPLIGNLPVRHADHHRNLFGRERGQVVVLFALLLPVISDPRVHRGERRQLVRAEAPSPDAGRLGGARRRSDFSRRAARTPPPPPPLTLLSTPQP